MTVDLAAAERKVYSQNGEDGVLEAILAEVGAPGQWFVEFGTETGVEVNCRLLAEQGWSGLFMEGDPAAAAALAETYRSQPAVQTRQAIVTPEVLEALLDEAGVPAEPDVFVIDVDSIDWFVWEALRRRPRVVVMEYNASLPLAGTFTQPREHTGWDGTDYFGASLGAFEWLAARRGYRLVHTERCGVNAFFVREDLPGAVLLPSGAAVVRNPPNYFDTGTGHPPDPADRPYLDVATRQLVARSAMRV
ncbi:MAG: hypothetical protein JHC95_07185 [Solirubrobacteraceae bacterium]|nr:hypothetical protein [Solirubrobacteraceae bacterium]